MGIRQDNGDVSFGHVRVFAALIRSLQPQVFQLPDQDPVWNGTILDNRHRLLRDAYRAAVQSWHAQAPLKSYGDPLFDDFNEIFPALLDGLACGYHARKAFYSGHEISILKSVVLGPPQSCSDVLGEHA